MTSLFSSRARVALTFVVLHFAACRGEPSPEESPQDERAPSPLETDYDVIVVGGGLAGLSAAAQLFGKRVLVLEKEERLGGRVYTKERDDVRYELGALFAYDPTWLPSGAVPSAEIPGASRVGFSERGATLFSETAIGLVDDLEGRSTDAPRFIKHDAARRALFGIIHPGEYADYIHSRRDDWRATYDTRRYENGNGELIDALARASGAEIMLGATASRVRDEGGRAVIDYVFEGEESVATGKVAIIATPADVATRLLGPLADDSLISRVRYAPGTVVVLGARPDVLVPFSYVATEDAGISGVFSRSNGETRILTVYFARAHHQAVRDLDDEEIVKRTIEHLGSMGIGEISESAVHFSDVHRWAPLGTIVSTDPYANWHDAVARPSARIILAGDYTHWDASQLPYGMPAATASGKRAATEALDALDDGSSEQGPDEAPAPITAAEAAMLHARVGLPTATTTRWPPLTTCEVFDIGPDAPSYLGRLDEGSTAPYGVLLLGETDDAIVEHLLESRVADLWEYSPGYGPTSADSVMVLEGLLAANVDAGLIERSLDALAARYFDHESGGFITVQRGRAPYWAGPSVDTTAMIAHLMQRVNPERFERELEASARYLLREQDEDGLFRGRWFPSWVLPTSYAVRFLARRPDTRQEYREPIERATSALVALQRDDGSVAGSVSETALLAITLAVTGNQPEALEAARRWITRRLERGVPPGDAFLYYWFENKDSKAFFSCRDKGRIAEAWGRAALREAPPPPQR